MEISDQIVAERDNRSTCEQAMLALDNAKFSSYEDADWDEVCSPFTLGLQRARTSAFISVVLAENVRAYTSRSYNARISANVFIAILIFPQLL